MYIGKKLKEILVREDISLAGLSDKSGIDRKDCEAFLENQKEPTLESFVQIVNGLDVSPSEFIETERTNIGELLAMQRKISELPLETQRELFKEIQIFLS